MFFDRCKFGAEAARVVARQLNVLKLETDQRKKFVGRS